jgi:isoleucyl-tRNA synthetase
VKVIAGESLEAKATIETQTPIMYLHFTLQPGAIAVQPVPREYNAFTYVLDGEGLFGAGKDRAGGGQMVVFAQDGEEVIVSKTSRPPGIYASTQIQRMQNHHWMCYLSLAYRSTNQLFATVVRDEYRSRNCSSN